MFELYPHQQQVIDDLRRAVTAGHRRVMLAAPTGSGKTVIASHIAVSAVNRGKRVLFIVHMKTLIWQAVRHFKAMGLKVGILQGENTDYADSDDIVVASIQTIHARKPPDWIDLVIVDEAHVLHKAHIELMQKWSALLFIGLSASPLREDLGKHFTELVRAPSVRWLTERGFLVPVNAFCPGAEHITEILDGIKCGSTANGYDYNQRELGEAMNQTELIGDIVETWKKHGEDRQTICFAVNKPHSRAIVDDFNAEDIPAAHIEDKTPDAERRELIDAFRAHEIRVLSSVGVLSIGFDVPDASCGILARPTQSPTLNIQQMGRVIRTADGKSDAILLDHAGNVLKHGLPVHFEVPDLRDEERTQKGKRKKRPPKMVACSNCGFALEPGQQTCPSCGVDRPKRRNDVLNRDGELVEYGSLDEGGKATVAEKLDFYLQLLWICHERGYSEGWAFHKHQEKFGEKPPWTWKAKLPRVASPATLRWIKSRNIAWAKSKAR